MLKNRATGQVYFVVLFTLYLKEDVNEDGSIKEGILGGRQLEGEHDHGHDDAATPHVENEKQGVNGAETSADDVD